MNRVTPLSDEHLFELLREIDPLGAGAPLPAGDEQERLLQWILSSERTRTLRVDRRGTRRRRLILGAASASGIAVAGAALALVLSAGSAPGTAFAGWAAKPGVPDGPQVQTAESECRRDSSLASLTPTLADARGPYTLLLYPENGGNLCVTGPSLQSPTGEPSIVPFGSFLSASATAGRRAAREQGHSTRKTRSNALVPTDAIRSAASGTATTASTSHATFSFDVGHAGTDVSKVTLVLQNGSRVQATTASGWFAAWWPGGERAQSAELTTAGGILTQRLSPPRTSGASSQERRLPTDRRRQTDESATEAAAGAHEGLPHDGN